MSNIMAVKAITMKDQINARDSCGQQVCETFNPESQSYYWRAKSEIKQERVKQCID